MKNLVPKKVRAVVFATFAAGILAGGASYCWQSTPLAVLAMIIIMVALGIHLIFYRCPHCGKFLDRSTGDYCPYCGQRMTPEDPPQDK